MQVPRLDVVHVTSVLSESQAQKMTFGGTRKRMVRPILKWMSGELCILYDKQYGLPFHPACMTASSSPFIAAPHHNQMLAL